MWKGIVILFVVAIVAMIKFLPWYAIVGVFLLVVISGKFFAGRIIESLLKIPFRQKGAVLYNAQVELHSVEKAAKMQNVEEDEEEEENDVEREYYTIDATIIPHCPTGNFRYWEPGELMLVKPGKSLEDGLDDETCVIRRLEINNEGEFVEDEGYKYPGNLRIRLHVGVVPTTKELEFAYYFENFGSVKLPA